MIPFVSILLSALLRMTCPLLSYNWLVRLAAIASEYHAEGS